MCAEKISEIQKISISMVYRLVKKFDAFGIDGLKTHKPGRLFEPLNPKFYNLVIETWKENKCGSRKLYQILKRDGFSVSQKKIQQVMDFEKLTKPCPKRRGQKSYKKYVWPLCNMLWHVDWSWCPRLEKWIIVYIDDCSRYIVGFGISDNATTENSLFVLYEAISKHGIPYQLLNDRGTQFYANKRTKDEEAEHDFEKALIELGIIQVKSRPHHPQTNGKNERWFGIYKQEYDERFESFGKFVFWYNNKRLSEAISYKTPAEIYLAEVKL